MSGQRTSAAEREEDGTTIAAGCALNETRRPTATTTTTPAADDNLLFAWGRGEDGQLGLGDTNDQALPTFIEALRGISVLQVAAGSGHTVVL